MSYYACVALTKLAILSLYLRLAFQKTFRRLIWACMTLVLIPVLAFEGVTIFQCIPIHKAWDATGSVPGTCVHVNAVFYAHAGLDIFQRCSRIHSTTQDAVSAAYPQAAEDCPNDGFRCRRIRGHHRHGEA